MAGAPPGVPSCPPSAHSSSLLACLAGRARAGLDPFQWGWVRPHSMLSTRSKFHNPPRCFQPDKGRSSTAYCESCLSRLLLFATQHGGIDFLVSSRGFQTFFSSSSKQLIRLIVGSSQITRRVMRARKSRIRRRTHRDSLARTLLETSPILCTSNGVVKSSSSPTPALQPPSQDQQLQPN